MLLLHLKINKRVDSYLTQKILSCSDQEVKWLLGVPRDAVLQFIKLRKQDRKTASGHPLQLTPADEVIAFLLHFHYYLVTFFLACVMDHSKKVIDSSVDHMRLWFYNLLCAEITMESYQW